MLSLFSCFPFNAEVHHPTGYAKFISPSATHEDAQSVCARQHPLAVRCPTYCTLRASFPAVACSATIANISA
jgi:hypothetical protein